MRNIELGTTACVDKKITLVNNEGKVITGWVREVCGRQGCKDITTED